MEQICKQESTKQELTVMDLMIKLGQLNEKLEKMDTENEQLKLDNEQLKLDNEILHNRLNENNNICLDKTLFEGNNPDNGYDEETLMYAYAMADKDKKFV